jgi:F-type H+-transporting ATPase subunit epsilon
MAQIAFQLVLPEQSLASEPADMVVVPGGEGDFGVLPGHVPMLSTVRPGVIEVYVGGKVKDRYMVAGGFAEVTGERCIVLAEEAYPFAEVTPASLQERASRAQQDIAVASSDTERVAAEKKAEVARELQRAHAYYSNRP